MSGQKTAWVTGASSGLGLHTALALRDDGWRVIAGARSFEDGEAELAIQSGAPAATLGRRILRAETAPLAALSIIMYQTDNFS